MIPTNHYATLGLESDCTDAQIRSAYRILAKQHHPDRNGGAAAAHEFTQALNAAYEVLGDPAERRRYDRLLQKETRQLRRASGRGAPVIEQEMQVRIEELLRGATLTLQVRDPGNPQGPEDYELVIPPGTAPNSRLRVERTAHPGGGNVRVKLKVLPGFQFKVRGSDLRCDLNISNEMARRGGGLSIRGPLGNGVPVEVPAGVARGEIIRVSGEGLPKSRGGRGDLLVRIMFQPEVRFGRKRGG